MKLYTANPSEETDQWYVWNMYEPLPVKPVFFGAMEEAINVAECLNARMRGAQLRSAKRDEVDAAS